MSELQAFIPTWKAGFVLRNITIVMSVVLLGVGIVAAIVAEPIMTVLLFGASVVLGASLILAWTRNRSLVTEARKRSEALKALPVIFLKGQVADGSGGHVALGRGWIALSAGRMDVFELGEQEPRFSFIGSDANNPEIEVVPAWRHVTVPRFRARLGEAGIEIELVRFDGPFVRAEAPAGIERVVGEAAAAVRSR